MSLFPAYDEPVEDFYQDKTPQQPLQDGIFPAYGQKCQDTSNPTWLTNDSFKDFQKSLAKSDVLVVSSESDECELRKEKAKRERSRSTSRTRKKKKKVKHRSRSRSRRRSRSRERNRHRSRSRDQRSRSRDKHKRYRSSSRDRKRAKNKKDVRGRSRSRTPNKQELIANSKYSAKKVFMEDVGVTWEYAFREDRVPDRTNLAGSGLYAKDIARYKSRLKIPLGETKKDRALKAAKAKLRFHQKQFIKQFTKAKVILNLSKENVARSRDEIEFDFRKSYLPVIDSASDNFQTKEKEVLCQESDAYNPLDIYDVTTVDYLKGVGGLAETDTVKVIENSEIQQKRLEFNSKLREEPTNVDLWIDFIDFQDEALLDSVFQVNDENETRKSRKKRGEVLRAKALTERKLAICKAAIEKNTRSIKLAVKRLELSKDLFDSKTLDQQWKELIFVYPENVDLWKRYLLFVQSHYIRFTVGDTMKAYRSCIVKLKQQQERLVEDYDNAKLFEVEHGILDILEQLACLLEQAGHSEKAVALFQGLVELNFFSPDFPGPGKFCVDDKISLLEPVWDSGVARVGHAGARGWGAEVRARVEEVREDVSGASAEDGWEDDILENVDQREKSSVWLQIELGREKNNWSPWRRLDEDPDDEERKVDFDTIQGVLVEFNSAETKYRLLYSFFKSLGVRLQDNIFSNLVESVASEVYFNSNGVMYQDFYEALPVLQPILPSFHTQEDLAIFIHHLFSQTYNKIKEPHRTKLMSLWLNYEAEIIERSSGSASKQLQKDLRRLVKSLLKEDRTNLFLVVKFAEVEYQLAGYAAAHNILDSSLVTAGKAVLLQKTEEEALSACLLYRAALELELREMVALRRNDPLCDDSQHRNRAQWLLVQIGVGGVFKPLSDANKGTMLALLEGAKGNYQKWIEKRIEVPSGQVFKMAPHIRHALVDVIFMYTWLLRLTEGSNEALRMLSLYRYRVKADTGVERFREASLVTNFVIESIDKVGHDLLVFDTWWDVGQRTRLRDWYKAAITRHPGSKYFQSQLSVVEDNMSVINSVWREMCRILGNRELTSVHLAEQASKVALAKFLKISNSDIASEAFPVAAGYVHKLTHLLERCLVLPTTRHSPLLWRLLLACSSLLGGKLHATQRSNNIMTLLYRALQEVPWCKALYLDTAKYLEQIGELYTTTTKLEEKGGEEDEEARTVEEIEIPGTLEHLTELMIEKEVRLRLPLQELEVLLSPLDS